MWAKFEEIPGEGNTIYLPSSFSGKIKNITDIKFGSHELVRANVQCVKEPETGEENSYNKPLKIELTTDLARRLLLPTSLVYRVDYNYSGINIGPVIGLLLGVHTHRYSPAHMKKYSDRMGIYNKIGGLVYAFSPKSVDWEKREAFGLYYNIQVREWEYGCFPLPEVIYRRDFHSNAKDIKKLAEITGNRLFNSYRFSKLELFNFLLLNGDMQKYLPPTEFSRSFEQVAAFINRHEKVIFKPVDLSRGRGMCIIEKSGSLYQISDYRYRHRITAVLNSQSALEEYFKLNQGFFKNYLVQKYLNLARIDNSRFDIRVVMQKQKQKIWTCTGIECRVSSDSHLTNISRGGYALLLNEALKSAFEKNYEYIPGKIDTLCRKICRQLDGMGHNFAELGMDIAVDEKKSVWFIEANVFPSFKGFKSTDYNTYLNIRYTPLLYALSLTEFDAKDSNI